MSQQSSIEWTDATWNPVRGCTKVSPGCAHCYAETFAERWRGVQGHPYERGFDLRLVPEKLTEPLSWKKPRRVFVNSMSDLFQDGVPDSFIDQVFAVMALTPQHTYQVLTKRPERMLAYMSDAALPARIDAVFLSGRFDLNGGRVNFVQRDGVEGWPLPNVWLGTSIENQHFADERIPLLLQTPASVRFISAEPLLGPVTFRWAKWDDWSNGAGQRRAVVNEHDGLRMLDWVIVGGESGPRARSFDLAWGRSIVEQCRAAGVSVFVKQLGAKPRTVYNDVERTDLTYLSRKGGDMSEWPVDLRVREFPARQQAR